MRALSSLVGESIHGFCFFKVCVCVAGDQTRGIAHSRQVLYHGMLHGLMELERVCYKTQFGSVSPTCSSSRSMPWVTSRFAESPPARRPLPDVGSETFIYPDHIARR
jgi:hypothetical protein